MFSIASIAFKFRLVTVYTIYHIERSHLNRPRTKLKWSNDLIGNELSYFNSNVGLLKHYRSVDERSTSDNDNSSILAGILPDCVRSVA